MSNIVHPSIEQLRGIDNYINFLTKEVEMKLEKQYKQNLEHVILMFNMKAPAVLCTFENKITKECFEAECIYYDENAKAFISEVPSFKRIFTDTYYIINWKYMSFTSSYKNDSQIKSQLINIFKDCCENKSRNWMVVAFTNKKQVDECVKNTLFDFSSNSVIINNVAKNANDEYEISFKNYDNYQIIDIVKTMLLEDMSIIDFVVLPYVDTISPFMPVTPVLEVMTPTDNLNWKQELLPNVSSIKNTYYYVMEKYFELSWNDINDFNKLIESNNCVLFGHWMRSIKFNIKLNYRPYTWCPFKTTLKDIDAPTLYIASVVQKSSTNHIFEFITTRLSAEYIGEKYSIFDNNRIFVNSHGFKLKNGMTIVVCEISDIQISQSVNSLIYSFLKIACSYNDSICLHFKSINLDLTDQQIVVPYQLSELPCDFRYSQPCLEVFDSIRLNILSDVVQTCENFNYAKDLSENHSMTFNRLHAIFGHVIFVLNNIIQYKKQIINKTLKHDLNVCISLLFEVLINTISEGDSESNILHMWMTKLTSIFSQFVISCRDARWLLLLIEKFNNNVTLKASQLQKTNSFIATSRILIDESCLEACRTIDIPRDNLMLLKRIIKKGKMSIDQLLKMSLDIEDE